MISSVIKSDVTTASNVNFFAYDISNYVELDLTSVCLMLIVVILSLILTLSLTSFTFTLISH